MVAHLLHRDGKPFGLAQGHDAAQGAGGILQGLAEQGLGELLIGTDALVERGGVGAGHRIDADGNRSDAMSGQAFRQGRLQAALARWSSSVPLAEASSMLRASRQSTLRSWA
jgi:hypothetical protein